MEQVATSELDLRREEYASSLTSVRRLGEVAINGYEPNSEAQMILNRVWNDFTTAIEENISTDQEFGEVLEFDSVKEWSIEDGRVLSEYGTPMIELVENGLESSRHAAESDSRMLVQVERDEGDLELMKQVDELQQGELLSVVSWDPRDAIRQDRKFWEEKMGYREGMVVVQTYYRLDEDTLLTSTNSIKRGNKQVMAIILQEQGSTVDENTPDGQWTKHPIKRQEVTEEDARNFGANLRSLYRLSADERPDTYSATDFVRKNHETLEQYFNAYLRPLSEAVYTGQNNDEIKSLAYNILQNAGQLDAETKRTLMSVANRNQFTDVEGRLMETMIRYAIVEELRKGIKVFVSGASKKIIQASISADETRLNRSPSPSVIYNEQALEQQRQIMNRQLSFNIQNGVREGRSYGGCSSATISGERDGDLMVLDNLGKQDVFGGISGEQNSQEESKDTDDLGDRNFECSKGHKNYRKVRNVREKTCSTCGENVYCGTIEPEEKESTKSAKVINIFDRINLESSSRKEKKAA